MPINTNTWNGAVPRFRHFAQMNSLDAPHHPTGRQANISYVVRMGKPRHKVASIPSGQLHVTEPAVNYGATGITPSQPQDHPAAYAAHGQVRNGTPRSDVGTGLSQVCCPAGTQGCGLWPDPGGQKLQEAARRHGWGRTTCSPAVNPTHNSIFEAVRSPTAVGPEGRLSNVPPRGPGSL